MRNSIKSEKDHSVGKISVFTEYYVPSIVILLKCYLCWHPIFFNFRRPLLSVPLLMPFCLQGYHFAESHSTELMVILLCHSAERVSFC
jgi:hypothetical protein